MRTSEDLARKLIAIDGRGYSSYRDIVGSYEIEGGIFSSPITLTIDRAQVDPYAPPSRVRVFVPQEVSGIPRHLINDYLGCLAVGDFLARAFEKAAHRSRDIRIAHPGQEILERTSVIVYSDGVEARFTVRLPASGRRIRGREARLIFLRELPGIVARSLVWAAIDGAQGEKQVSYVRERERLLRYMERDHIVAFIGDGSILPRESGDSDAPLSRGAIPFASPQEFRCTYELGNSSHISGMAIPEGITVIVGGGFHGKSTLLRAIQRGVYPHISGDGREWVVTCSDAVAVRAEDGRSVTNTDISPFINGLPSGKSTQSFSTANASGSTSQAANMMEALEAGAQVLIIDEDTSATNFMIRDSVMRRLISSEYEPITPLIDKVTELRDLHGISTIIVAGGSSAFLEVADTVIAMKSYEPHDVTREAHELIESVSREGTREDTNHHTQEYNSDRYAAGGERLRVEHHDMTADNASAEQSLDFRTAMAHQRIIDPASLHPHDKKKPAKATGLHEIRFGHCDVVLHGLEQLVDPAQTAAIAQVLERIADTADGSTTVREVVDDVLEHVAEIGLDALVPRGQYPGNLALPRRHEIMATINRMRGLVML